MKALSTEWTKDCNTVEEKQKLEKLLRNSTKSLSILRKIILRRMQGLQRSERLPEAYNSPNWAFLQAHTNGMIAAYNNIDQLLSFIEDK